MPGVAEGIHFPEVAGYISVPRQRPLQGAVTDHAADTAAQCQQMRAQFVRQQLVKNVALVLREIVFLGQLSYTFAADRDVQDMLCDQLRVRFVLGRLRCGSYGFNF